MAFKKPALPDDHYYSKKIIHIYGWMVFLAFAVPFFGLFSRGYLFNEYTFSYLFAKILFPVFIQVFILLLLSILMKYKKIYHANLLIIAGTVLAFISVLHYPELPSLQVIFLLMMAVSLLYFDKKKLRTSLYINIIALTSLYVFPSFRSAGNVFYEYLTFLFILLAGYMVFRIIVKRGVEVHKVLQQAAEKEQYLIVKSTMMERLTKIDALTNLYNHKTFHEYLEFLYEQSVSQGMPLQLAIIDIDDFKMINDTYGHDKGDMVIRKVADILSESVTEDEIVARYGGEEFTILFTNKTLEAAYELLENIRLKIASQQYEDLDEKVTVSIGLQNLERDMCKTDFFQKTDMLLYTAKQTGKNLIFVEGITAGGENQQAENRKVSPEAP